MNTRKSFLILSLLAGAACAGPSKKDLKMTTGTFYLQKEDCPAVADSRHRFVDVWLDHELKENVPESDKKIKLFYVVSKDFDPRRPTIFRIRDAQSYEGALGQPDKYKSLLKTPHNVVQVEQRGHKCAPVRQVYRGKIHGEVNWKKAYRYFSWHNYVGDIEAVRKDLLGDDAKIILWGQSGAGHLAFQYLTLYPSRVSQAIIAKSAGTKLKSLGPDGPFEESLKAEGIQELLNTILAGNADAAKKHQILYVVQRMGYDFTPERRERKRMLEAILAGDDSILDRQGYGNVFDSASHFNRFYPNGTVRCAEFGMFPRHDYYQYGPRPEDRIALWEPLMRPLTDLLEKGALEERIIHTWDGLKDVSSDVLLIGFQKDHVISYDQIVEASRLLPRSHMIGIDDTHIPGTAQPVNKRCYEELTGLFAEHGFDKVRIAKFEKELGCRFKYH